MSRRRLFCSRKRLEDGVFTVAGDEAHHGVVVCRLRPGDEVFVFTERGVEFRCQVVSARKGQLKARVVEKLEDAVESPLELTLVQALPKAAKLEEVIVRGTELGLGRLLTVRSERSAGGGGGGGGGGRPERWRRLALEATKQSGRRMIPVIEPPVPLEKLDLEQFSGSLRILACERPCAGSLRELVRQFPPGGRPGAASPGLRPRPCREPAPPPAPPAAPAAPALSDTPAPSLAPAAVVAAGPEGGFTEAEMRRFIDAGFRCVGLGRRTLRTETASLALLAALQYELGDWETGRAGDPACG